MVEELEHTEEPLDIGGKFQGNREPTPNCLLKDGTLIAKFERVVDTIRAMACYNACKGISTKALEGGVIEEMIKSTERDADYYGKNSSAQRILTKMEAK